MQQLQHMMDNVKLDIARIKENVEALQATTVGASVSKKKVKVPELVVYTGIRDVKLFKNILWDIEHYFEMAIVLEDEQVAIVTL